MKRYVSLLVLLLAFNLPQFFAEAAAEGSAIKIATVNFQEALNQVDQGKRAKEELKKEFEARQKKLDLQQEDLKKMQEDLGKQKIVLSQEAFQKKEAEFNEKFMNLQKNFAGYRQEIAQKEAQMTAAIITNLKKICAEIGKKEGYALIVETSQDAVLYAEAKEDVTGRVVKEYNKQFKGSLKFQ